MELDPYMVGENRRHAIENLSRHKNLSSLDFDIDALTKIGMKHWSQRGLKFEDLGSGQIRVYQPKKKFSEFYGDDYNLASILTSFPELHKHEIYLRYLDYLTGYAMKNPPKNQTKEQLKEILKHGLIVNFAETGSVLSFYEFLKKKRFRVLELEPLVYKNNRLDLKLDVKQEIMVEAYAPIAKTTLDPNKMSISKMLDHEIKEHSIQKIRKPVIILIMQNCPFWGGNPMNGGKLNDFMLHPVEACVKDRQGAFDPCISAVVRKVGSILFFHTNKNAQFPLPESFVKDMCNHYYLDRIFFVLRYKYKSYFLNRRIMKMFKEDKYTMALLRSRNVDLQQRLKDWIRYLEDFPI